MVRRFHSIATLMFCCTRVMAFEVGETVVAIHEAKVHRDNVIVDDVWLGQNLRIEAIDDERFWVNSDHPGWVSRADVEQLDRAWQLFTDLLQKDPKDSRYYNARGNTGFQIRQRDRKPIFVGLNGGQEEFANDFDNAIRLSPKAFYYRNRGMSRMPNLTSVIQDLDEAIRRDPSAATYADRGMVKLMNDQDSDDDFANSIQLDPSSIRPYVNRARAARAEARKFDDWSQVIQLDPYHDEAYANRGQTWVGKGERLRALMDFKKAIELNPRNSAAFEMRAFNHIHLHNFAQAIQDYNSAEALGRTSQIFMGMRAYAHTQLRKYDKAIDDYNASISVQPNSPSIFRKRAECRRLNGEYQAAIVDLRHSIELAEKTKIELDEVSFTYNTLAWLYATCPDASFRNGPESLQLAKKACDLNGGGSPFDHDTLAAAYAEVSDFEEAIKYQTQAVKDAPEVKREAYSKRLELYQSKQPFRDPPKK